MRCRSDSDSCNKARPEYKAGWANKEKIDYAIFIDGQASIFVEAKSYGEKLVNYDAQLAKYFNSSPDVKIAIITDGVTYKFFTDSQQLNLMDTDPLFEFEIGQLKPQDFEVLAKLRRDHFDVESIITESENLVYLRGFMKKLKQSFNHPDDDFVRFLAADIYPNRITTKAIERLQPLVKQAVSTTLVAMVSKGLASSISEADDDDISQEKPDSVEKSPESDNTSKVETTQQELDAYKFILDAIEQEFGAKSEVNYKDTQSYFSIQIQKPSRWFCRLHFNNQKRIYVAFRLSENKAKELVHPELIESYTSSTTDGCSVTFENQNSLQAMLPLFLESYKSIANEYKVGVSAEL